MLDAPDARRNPPTERCMLEAVKAGADFSRGCAGGRIGLLLFATHPYHSGIREWLHASSRLQGFSPQRVFVHCFSTLCRARMPISRMTGQVTREVCCRTFFLVFSKTPKKLRTARKKATKPHSELGSTSEAYRCGWTEGLFGSAKSLIHNEGLARWEDAQDRLDFYRGHRAGQAVRF